MVGIRRIPEMWTTHPVEYRFDYFWSPSVERRMEFACVFRHFRCSFDNVRMTPIYKENEKRERREKNRFIDFTTGTRQMEVGEETFGSLSKCEIGGHSCTFFAVRLRALGFDECCVIECNHNNVLFGMLSKVHRCINKMHLILNDQTGVRNSPDIVDDMKPIPGTTKR